MTKENVGHAFPLLFMFCSFIPHVALRAYPNLFVGRQVQAEPESPPPKPVLGHPQQGPWGIKKQNGRGFDAFIYFLEKKI